jgi:hypothetical protein
MELVRDDDDDDDDDDGVEVWTFYMLTCVHSFRLSSSSSS